MSVSGLLLSHLTLFVVSVCDLRRAAAVALAVVFGVLHVCTKLSLLSLCGCCYALVPFPLRE